MGGQDGTRGYLLQAISAVLQSLTARDWVNISIEPNDSHQKVDIQYWDAAGETVVTQVKSSVNNFDKADLLKILADLINDAPAAKRYILTAIGTYSADTVKFFNHLDQQNATDFGSYLRVYEHRDKVRTELKALDIEALDGQIESRIHAFLSVENYIVPHQVIHLIALGLQAQFSRFATNGQKISRERLEEQIISWMKYNYPKELRRDHEKLALGWYYENTLQPPDATCPVLHLSADILTGTLSEQTAEIKELIEKIRIIKLPATQPEAVPANSRFDLESIFGPYGRLSAAFTDEEVRNTRALAADLLAVDLPEDFFQVGQVQKIDMLRNTLFIGGGPEFRGTPDEVAKREAISDFIYKLNRLKDISHCKEQWTVARVLPLVIINDGDSLQTGVELQLNFPEHIQVWSARNFPTPAYNANMKLLTYDAGIAQRMFIMPETSKVKSYDYRMNIPINFPDLSPFHGRQYKRQMEQNLEWIFDYKIYDDQPGIQTISCVFKQLKPKQAMAMPSYILVYTETPFELSYLLKSNESGGNSGKLVIR